MSITFHCRGTFKFDDIYNFGTQEEVSNIEAQQDEIIPDSGCNIQFTSGTTGNPKAALMSHYNFVNNGFYIGKRMEYDLKHHRICCQTPLFHAYGIVIGVLAALNYGTTIVLPDPGFDTAKTLEAIEREKCTVIYGTPTMYVDLVTKQRELQRDVSSVEIATTGGATCTPELFRNIKNGLNVKKVKTVFGMTEVSAVIFQSLFDETESQVLNTVGHVQEHIEVKVVDEQGRTVPFGERGELCVRGYNTMLEYWGEPEKTKEMISNDKWLRTGDQFELQEDGYGRIVGRLKEMIIRGGENLFPKEIEDFLTTNAKVLEVHVVGVPDKRMGEEMCAFIKLEAGETMSLAEMKAFCKGQIAHFKVPRYLEIVDDFPKTVSGKIQKFRLVEQWKNAMEKQADKAA